MTFLKRGISAVISTGGSGKVRRNRRLETRRRVIVKANRAARGVDGRAVHGPSCRRPEAGGIGIMAKEWTRFMERARSIGSIPMHFWDNFDQIREHMGVRRNRRRFAAKRSWRSRVSDRRSRYKAGGRGAVKCGPPFQNGKNAHTDCQYRVVGSILATLFLSHIRLTPTREDQASGTGKRQVGKNPSSVSDGFDKVESSVMTP